MSSQGQILKDNLKKYSQDYRSRKDNIVLTNAVAKSGINAVAFNNEVLARMQHKFSEEIETLKVTNQKSSGRCWLFAALNMLRDDAAKKHKLEYFEFSQNYQAFWDKFEKSNYFLESIIDTLDEPLEGRLVTWLMQNVLGDGGQWDMFVNLVKKYGVVPKDAMPETHHSSNTGDMNRLLITMLRRKAMELRSSYENGTGIEEIRGKKDQMIGELYRFFCIFFGEPPDRFDYEYKDKDKTFHALRNVTPLEFYDQFVGIDLDEYVSIINAPTKDKPFGKTFTVRFLGNVVGGKDVMYYNTDIKTMKELAISQLKDNKPVWFGCDVGKMLDRDLGINDAELFRYDLALDMESKLTKAQRLDYRESCMTHAMVFQGVNLVGGVPNRWKVENSWGDEKGDKGYFIMSDSWFDEYMYQVVVHKKYLTPEIIAGLDQKPIELDPWDPMGSLAKPIF